MCSDNISDRFQSNFEFGNGVAKILTFFHEKFSKSLFKIAFLMPSPKWSYIDKKPTKSTNLFFKQIVQLKIYKSSKKIFSKTILQFLKMHFKND